MGKNELKEKLTSLQYRVTQRDGTERPFKNRYWDNKEDGIYVDILSGEPLFSSKDKFDSGTGRPSFTRPLVTANIVEKEDYYLFSVRTEVRSEYADSHLGHLFYDGPQPLKSRYCINSAALRFIPVNELEQEGYGKFISQFKKELNGTAAFAAGCFWGVEALFKKISGVLETRVGYVGGAETVRVKFDPNIVSYSELLGHFWWMHDPTTLNRQGVDIGSQYRSAIFYYSDKQKKLAEDKKRELDNLKTFKRKIATEITAMSHFSDAEAYHQNYYERSGGQICQNLKANP